MPKVFYILGIFCGITLPSTVFSYPSDLLDNCKKVESIALSVQEIRQLKAKEPLRCMNVDAPTFRRLAHEIFSEDLNKNRLKFDTIVQKFLGYIPDDYDYERCLFDGSTSEILAFYHPTLRSMIIPSWELVADDVIAHEVVHALQDQYANLNRMRKLANKSSDSALAMSALVEGDAILTQEKFLQKYPQDTTKEVGAVNFSPLPPAPGCSLPPLLLDQFAFPYDFGPIFVKRLREDGGDSAVNWALMNIPQSTTEILYKNKYVLKGKTKQNNTKQPAGRVTPGAKLVYSDVLGEFNIRLLLKSLLPKTQAILAAKGWFSDSVGLYQLAGQKILLVWDTTWESELEATQFYLALIEFWKKRLSLPQLQHSSTILISNSEFSSVNLSQRGRKVRLSIAKYE